jgi:hypothetical protein
MLGKFLKYKIINSNDFVLYILLYDDILVKARSHGKTSYFDLVNTVIKLEFHYYYGQAYTKLSVEIRNIWHYN